MISEVSCDTEDWSNDHEKSALLHMNKFYLKVHYNRICCFKLQYYFRIFCILDQIYTSLMSIRYFFTIR